MPSSTAGGTSALASRRAAPCSKRASFHHQGERGCVPRWHRMGRPQSPDEHADHDADCRGKLPGGGGMLDQARAGARLAARVRKVPAVAAAGREAQRKCQDLLWRAVLLSRRVRRRTVRPGGKGLWRGAPARPRQASCSRSARRPARKRSQCLSNFAIGTRVSPGERWSSIRGARQTSSRPRTSSSGQADAQ